MTCITDKGLKIVSELPELEELQLVGSRGFTDIGIKELARLRNLRIIGLEGTGIGDSSLGYLSSFPKLKKVNLAFTDITDKGFLQLAKARSLERIDLRGTRVSRSAEAELRKVLPNVVINRGEYKSD